MIHIFKGTITFAACFSPARNFGCILLQGFLFLDDTLSLFVLFSVKRHHAVVICITFFHIAAALCSSLQNISHITCREKTEICIWVNELCHDRRGGKYVTLSMFLWCWWCFHGSWKRRREEEWVGAKRSWRTVLHPSDSKASTFYGFEDMLFKDVGLSASKASCDSW